jgi:hypothetical protein
MEGVASRHQVKKKEADPSDRPQKEGKGYVTEEQVRYLSEEISSRVAESTRLILVKDRFGGDLGALDR